MIYKFVVCLP